MGFINIIDNIGLYIMKFIKFVFTTSPDSYAPINLTNIKYLAFILGLVLFLLENFIILFFRGISDVLNKYSPTEIPHFNVTDFIDFRAIMALIVVLSFINIFFTKNILKTLSILGMGVLIFFSKNIIKYILSVFTIDLDL